MTSKHRTERLRVDAPTLEPDPAFLGMLAHLSTSSRSAAPRTTRSAGLRMIAATASVAVITAATWAAGTQTGAETPHSPADRPTQEEATGLPSRGDVGAPQPDVSVSPGSPPSPGLPGTGLPASDRAVDPTTSRQAAADRGPAPKSKNDGKAQAKGKAKGVGKGKRPSGKRPVARGAGQPRGLPPAVSGRGPRSAAPPGRALPRHDSHGRSPRAKVDQKR